MKCPLYPHIFPLYRHLPKTILLGNLPVFLFGYPQELAAISLDVSRNSMIAVDIRLAMLNLGVASSACVFGAMGKKTALQGLTAYLNFDKIVDVYDSPHRVFITPWSSFDTMVDTGSPH